MKTLRDLFLIRPGVHYLNHGAYGACPKPVFEAYQAWQLELERQPLEFLSRRGGQLKDDARAVLGQFVGAASEDLAFVMNTTVGVNIVARCMGLEPGDEVLAPDHEYGALDRTWRFVCGERGAHYVKQHVPVPVRSHEEIEEIIWSGVTPRTKVLYWTHITSSTGLIFPVQGLIRRAREAGIISVIDGAHVPGQMDLNIAMLDPDFYIGNCHKWLLSPKGAGFLYTRRDQHHRLKPLIVSWGYRDPDPSTLHSMVEVQGTRDIAAFLSVPAAIRFQQEHNWPQVQQRCHEIVRQARRQLAEVIGLDLICPDSPQWFRQMASVRLPEHCNAEHVRQVLIDRFNIEVGGATWNKLPLMRTSIQAYNDEADVAALVAAMKELLPELMAAKPH